MDEGPHAFNVIATTISQINDVTNFNQLVPVSFQSGSNR